MKSEKGMNHASNRLAMISTTRIAILHRELPRDRRFVKDSCPGVSMISKPGILKLKLPSLFTTAVFVLIASTGK